MSRSAAVSVGNYRFRLNQIIDSAPSETFPGQNEEIKQMTLSSGCDICEHVPTLIQYARNCETVSEMGVRFGWSTRAFLFARPKKLHSIDKYDWDSTHQSGMYREVGNSKYHKYKDLYKGVVDFTFQHGDSTKIPSIESTDLLFIDTFHHRDSLTLELEHHGNQARRFIILHDTETFGDQGQADDSKIFFDQTTTNEIGTGLWYAIYPWLERNKHWRVTEHYENNNGLTVLERIG